MLCIILKNVPFGTKIGVKMKNKQTNAYINVLKECFLFQNFTEKEIRKSPVVHQPEIFASCEIGVYRSVG